MRSLDCRVPKEGNQTVKWFAAFLLLTISAQAQQGPSLPSATQNAAAVIAAGNTFQQVLATGTRRWIYINNNNATDSCWVYLGALADATKGKAFLLPAGRDYGRYFPYVPTDGVQATCATTSDTLYVDYN